MTEPTVLQELRRNLYLGARSDFYRDAEGKPYGRPARVDPCAASAEDFRCKDRPDLEPVSIDAKDLRSLILEAAEKFAAHADADAPPTEGQRPNPHGLLIRYAVIKGTLELYNLEFRFPLRFQECFFKEDVVAGRVRSATLEFTACRIRNFILPYAVVNGDVRLDRSCVLGVVDLERAQIEASVLARQAIFRTDPLGTHSHEPWSEGERGRDHLGYPKDYCALYMPIAKVGAALELDKSILFGSVFLSGAEVGKRVRMNNAVFLGFARGRTAALEAARSGDVKRLETIVIDRAMVRQAAREGRMLQPRTIRSGGLSCQGTFEMKNSIVIGDIDLIGSHFGGVLDLTGTWVSGYASRSVRLDRAQVEGDLLLGDRYANDELFEDPAEARREVSHFRGAFRMRKAHVKGDLILREVIFDALEYASRFSFRATGAVVEGELRADLLVSRGSFDLANMVIRRRLRMRRAVFSYLDHRKDGRPPTRRLNAAIEANFLSVGSDLEVEGVFAHGPVYLEDAHIAGGLRIIGGRFLSCSEPAINAERIFVGADLEIRGQERSNSNGEAPRSSFFRGGVILQNAKIEGSFYVDDVVMLSMDMCHAEKALIAGGHQPFEKAHRGGDSIDASGARVQRSISISGGCLFLGTVNLSTVRVGDEVQIWSSVVAVDPRSATVALRLSSSEIGSTLRFGSAITRIRQGRSSFVEPCVTFELDGIANQAHRDHFAEILTSHDGDAITDLLMVIGKNDQETGKTYEGMQDALDLIFHRAPPQCPDYSFIALGRVVVNAASVQGFLRIQSAFIEMPLSESERAFSAGGSSEAGSENEDEPFSALALNLNSTLVKKTLFSYRPTVTLDLGDMEQQEQQPDNQGRDFRTRIIGAMSLENSNITEDLLLEHFEIYASHHHFKARSDDQRMVDWAGAFYGRAIVGDNLTVGGNIQFGRYFRSLGEVSLVRASVGQRFITQGNHEVRARYIYRGGRRNFSAPKALFCQSIRVGISVDFMQTVLCWGCVDFTLAEIASSFRCMGREQDERRALFAIHPETVTLHNRKGTADAIELSDARIGRHLIFENEVRFYGNVDLNGVQIGNDLEFWLKNIHPPHEASLVHGASGSDGEAKPPEPANPDAGPIDDYPVLSAVRLSVSGTIYWGRNKYGEEPDRIPRYGDLYGEQKVRLDLSNAHARRIIDHRDDWPMAGLLEIRGFVYERMEDNTPINAADGMDDTNVDYAEHLRVHRKYGGLSWNERPKLGRALARVPGARGLARLVWLDRQEKDNRARIEHFAMQPYTQAVNALAAVGATASAEIVDIHRQRLFVRAIFSDVLLGLRMSWILQLLYDWTVGFLLRYGYQPARLLIAFVVFTIIGWLTFDYAYRTVDPGRENAPKIGYLDRCMVPSQEEVYVQLTEQTIQSDGSAKKEYKRTDSSAAEEYPRFHSFLYALDTFIPLVDLNQEDYWIPGRAAHCSFPMHWFSWGPLARWISSSSERTEMPETSGAWVEYAVNPFKVFLTVHQIVGAIVLALFGTLIAGLIRPKSD